MRAELSERLGLSEAQSSGEFEIFAKYFAI
jgi:hypothetical protein